MYRDQTSFWDCSEDGLIYSWSRSAIGIAFLLAMNSEKGVGYKYGFESSERFQKTLNMNYDTIKSH